MRAAMLVATVLLITHSSEAEYRVKVDATVDGAAIEDAEVCFYPYEIHNPFSAFDSPPFRCISADKIIAFPTGRQFAFFVRHPSGLISPNPMTLAPAEGAEGYQQFRFDLRQGARLDFADIMSTLNPGERLALILGGGETSGAYAVPVSEPMTLVPADVPLVPVMIRNDSVVAIGQILKPGPGQTTRIDTLRDEGGVILRVVPEDPTTGTTPDLSTGLCERPYTPEAIKILMKQSPPAIALVDSDGVRFESVLAPAHTDNMLTGLYVFEAVPPGVVNLAVSGGHWQRTASSLAVGEGITVIAPPFTARLGGTLTIASNDVMDRVMRPEPPACDEGAEVAAGSFELLRCPDQAENSRAGCTVAESRSAAGEPVSFRGVEAGHYRLVARLGEEVVADSAVEVVAGTDQTSRVEPSGFYVTGRVTADGEPVSGTVRFRSGQATTSSRGEFMVRLSSDPGSSPIRFMSCDEIIYYHYQPSVPLISGSSIHIEVPMHSVVTRVEDASTGAELEDATANVAILMDEKNPDSVDYFAMAVEENGENVARYIEQGKAYRLCADHPGYESACGETRIKKEGSETATVKLKPARERIGRVLGDGYTSLYWALPDGTVTESVRIDPEGEFLYLRDHGPAEFVVLVGTSPLYVATSPDTDEEVEIPIANRLVRSVTTRVEQEGRTALVALWIDGVRVPNQALAEHQMMRRERMFIMNGAPATYRDITGTILAFAAGPDPNLLPPGTDISDPRLFLGIQPRTVSGNEIVLDSPRGADGRRVEMYGGGRP